MCFKLLVIIENIYFHFIVATCAALVKILFPKKLSPTTLTITCGMVQNNTVQFAQYAVLLKFQLLTDDQINEFLC